MPKEKITIEDLARITQNGFLEMNDRFQQVGKRFDNVDKRFDEMDKKNKDSFYRVHADILQVKEKIAEIVTKLDNVRVRTLEDDDAISAEIIKLENEINWIKDDIKRIKMRQKMKA